MLKTASLKSALITLLVLAAIAIVLFHKSFSADQVIFSNDAPLGALSTEAASMKSAMRGVWNDLNWIGIENPAALPHTASAAWFLLGDNAVLSSKFHVPLALIVLGLSLWFLLRQFGFRHTVCGLAAIAAMLNMNTFSHSTWGLPSRAWTLASTFMALAALRSGVVSHPLLKALLAGLAVANGIMEGFDVGAIFSLYVGAFAVFIALAQPGDLTGGKIAKALLRATLVAVFAALCAAAALSTLIGTQVKGVVGMEQDAETRRQRWDAATMWSLPKVETLRVLVPGLFGYRMDAEEGANYWGAVGQSPGYPTSRHSGAGEYAGILVVLVAAFAVANAFRKKNNPFTDLERRCVYFFSIAAFVSVLFAWGRHAPFYQIIYALPFFSTIRNPIKFMHPFHMALLILFGFGLEALCRLYLKETESKAQNVIAAIKAWRATAPAFERRWTFGLVGFGAVAFLGAMIYISSRQDLIKHLGTAGFPQPLADQIARFSYAEVGLALAHLTLAILLLISILSGWFSGRRARLLVGIVGAVLLVDLIPANKPWVVYYNYKDRYASNPVIDFLRENPHEHRVTARVGPFLSNNYLVDPTTTSFVGVANQWLQHHFQYYNIQSLEPVQMPRPPAIDQQFFMAMIPSSNRPPSVLTRMWELSNTRYLLGGKQALVAVARELDAGRDRIKILKTFDMTPKPGIANPQTIDEVDWILHENGRFALAEFSGALPRVKLYPVWRKASDDDAVLNELIATSFDPSATAFLHGETPITPGTSTNFSGDVKITSYAPKRIELAVSNSAPALLLYNDKYSPNWRLTINDQPATLHRANFIMRGIPLPAGQHRLLMTYSQPMTGLFISLGSMLVGFVVLGFLVFASRKVPAQTEAQK
jgi:hypothetical protein